MLIVAPENIGELKNLSQDQGALEDLYEQGLRAVEAIPEFIEE